MKVKVISVHNHGNQNEEYVLLRVLEDCNIGDYMLADSTYTSTDRVSNKVRHTYWFPDKDVLKGELVSLRTKKGTNIETKSEKGTVIHRFYWGLNESVWNDDGDCAILFLVQDYKLFRVHPASD